MVDEDELEKLKEQRQNQLEETDQEDLEEQREQQQNQIISEARNYMTEDARDRMDNIKTVKPELAASVAQQIVRLGNSGQIGTINDQKMKQILKSVQQDNESKNRNIKFRK